MYEAGGDGAEKETAEESVTVGREHNEVGAIQADDVLNDRDGVAGVNDKLGRNASEMLSGKRFQASGFSFYKVVCNSGGRANLPAEFGGIKYFWSAGADQLEMSLKAPGHFVYVRNDGNVGIGIIYREQNPFIREHLAGPPSAVTIGALWAPPYLDGRVQ